MGCFLGLPKGLVVSKVYVFIDLESCCPTPDEIDEYVHEEALITVYGGRDLTFPIDLFHRAFKRAKISQFYA